MGEFECGDDWDLDAVVRGYISQASHSTCDIMEWFDSYIDDPIMRSAELDAQFPVDFSAGSLETTTALDDLETGLHSYPAALPASCSPVSSLGKNVEMDGAGKLQEGAGSSAVAALPDTDVVHATAKYKRRKNQSKQVVRHITSDSVSSDLWAWRKYGQKPIKGSPFPRSYYRCSSSKGCLARKQVEQSCSEPGMFIVTYTGEHCHSQPTRRSALAGISRPSKFSAHKKPTSVGGTINGETLLVPKLPKEITINHQESSATPAPTATTEDGRCKQERLAWGEGENDAKFVNHPSFVPSEEIFMGFDELEGLGMDFALSGC